MNLQDDRISPTPTESVGEATESLWFPADFAAPAPGNARDDDLVERLAIQLDQWLHDNGCRLTTTLLTRAAPSAPSAAPTNTATHISSGVPPC